MNKIFELSDVMDNEEELYDEDDEYFDEEDEDDEEYEDDDYFELYEPNKYEAMLKKYKSYNEAIIYGYLNALFVEAPILDENGFKTFVCEVEDNFYRMPKKDESRAVLRRYRKEEKTTVNFFVDREPQLFYNKKIYEIPVTANTLIDLEAPCLSNRVEESLMVREGFDEVSTFLEDLDNGILDEKEPS